MGRSKRELRNGSNNEGGRLIRLQELIREEVNLLLRGEVADARLQDVAITFVELAGDGSCARLWFTATEDRTEALERAAGFLRTHLAESLALKRTPELRFRRDPTTRT